MSFCLGRSWCSFPPSVEKVTHKWRSYDMLQGKRRRGKSERDLPASAVSQTAFSFGLQSLICQNEIFSGCMCWTPSVANEGQRTFAITGYCAYNQEQELRKQWRTSCPDKKTVQDLGWASHTHTAWKSWHWAISISLAMKKRRTLWRHFLEAGL